MVASLTDSAASTVLPNPGMPWMITHLPIYVTLKSNHGNLEAHLLHMYELVCISERVR